MMPHNSLFKCGAYDQTEGAVKLGCLRRQVVPSGARVAPNYAPMQMQLLMHIKTQLFI